MLCIATRNHRVCSPAADSWSHVYTGQSVFITSMGRGEGGITMKLTPPAMPGGMVFSLKGLSTSNSIYTMIPD